MIALVKTTFENGVLKLPPMEDDFGGTYCLLCYDDQGAVHGGYSMIEELPPGSGTWLVQVECSQQVFDTMLSDDLLRLELVEVLNDGFIGEISP